MGDYEYETDSGCLSVRVHVRDPKEKEGKPPPKSFYIGLAEASPSAKLFKSLTAEFIATLLLVLIGCGSCTGGDALEAPVQIDDQANIVRISLCFGITVATLAQTIGHVSGCHINPAVTFGLMTGGKIGVLKGLLYIVFQCLGALGGAGILYGINYSKQVCQDKPEPSADETTGQQDDCVYLIRGSGGLGQTLVSPDITLGHAVAVEMLVTFVLVLIVFASAADANNASSVKGSAPLAIGLSITACHLWAIPLTGSSMNPARSLGPSIVMRNTGDLWVYWVGPLLGAFVAAVLYQVVFAADDPNSAKETKRPTPIRKQTGDFYKKATPVRQIPQLPADKSADQPLVSKSNGDKDLPWIEAALDDK